MARNRNTAAASVLTRLTFQLPSPTHTHTVETNIKSILHFINFQRVQAEIICFIISIYDIFFYHEMQYDLKLQWRKRLQQLKYWKNVQFKSEKICRGRG